MLDHLKIGGAFASFYPLVKKYVVEKLFTEKIDLNDPRVLYYLSSPEIQEKLINAFIEVFKDKTFTEKEPTKKETIKLSNTKPFIWPRLVYPANKCIFNYVPCDSNLEVDFTKFLDRAEDVESFTKIVVKIGFYIEYISKENLLRFYYPDFVVKTTDGNYLLIETKGLVDEEVPHKDERAKKWCEDTTNLTDNKWSYIRVNQKDFEKYRYKTINELKATI
jgi:type III restriction enzyme